MAHNIVMSLQKSVETSNCVDVLSSMFNDDFFKAYRSAMLEETELSSKQNPTVHEEDFGQKDSVHGNIGEHDDLETSGDESIKRNQYDVSKRKADADVQHKTYGKKPSVYNQMVRDCVVYGGYSSKEARESPVFEVIFIC